jgi:hypothetical protein
MCALLSSPQPQYGDEAGSYHAGFSQPRNSHGAETRSGDDAGQTEVHLMTRYVLLTLAVALLTLGACSDARKLPTAPNSTLSKTAMPSARSTVCTTYRRKLRLLKVQYARKPNANLGTQIRSLGSVVTDACN